MIRLALLSVLLLASSPSETGSLRVTSLPGVVVEWEGVVVGETDADGILTIGGIPTGGFRVTLSKSGYRRQDFEVVVTPGETVLNLGLERLPPPRPKPAMTKPEAEPAPAPARREPALPQPGPVLRPEPPPSHSSSPPISPEPAPPSLEPDPPAPRSAVAIGSQESNEPMAGLPAAAGNALPVRDEGKLPPGVRLLMFVASLILAVGLAAVLARRQGRRRGRTVHARRPGRQRPADVPSSSAGSPGFLKDLQRREEYVESVSYDEDGREIIEVTDVEILDEDEP